jgi:hypothetical protein
LGVVGVHDLGQEGLPLLSGSLVQSCLYAGCIKVGTCRGIDLFCPKRCCVVSVCIDRLGRYRLI